jgi:hypothetical protein
MSSFLETRFFDTLTVWFLPAKRVIVTFVTTFQEKQHYLPGVLSVILESRVNRFSADLQKDKKVISLSL